MAAKTFLNTALTISLFLVVLPASTTAHAKIIYVDDDADGANDGSSWADAYNFLQDALAVANDGDEIRVAQGIYKPDKGAIQTPGDRTATFQLINGVILKGSYAGYGEPDPDARELAKYGTILSGDLNGDDFQVKHPLGLLYEPTRAENSRHVITGGNGILDGFIITAGNATTRSGGGMENSSGSPKLINCIFRGNSARSLGGGLYNEEGSPILINCIFSGNSARSGAGMWCGDSGKPTLINCTLSGNSASYDGGGMGNNESDPVLTNCIFWGNSDCTGVELYAQISGGDDPVVNYCCIQGLIGNFGGTGNIGDHPLFVEADGADNIPGTADDNLRLLPSSPCIDSADNSAIQPSVFTDLDGDPRIKNGTVDMGAYEGSHQGFLLSTESVTVPEGMTASFSVELALDPQGMLKVTVSRQSGDPDITVESGASLTFDSSNYFQPQTVTLAASEDLDNLNSSALIKVSGSQLLAAGIRATEQDNDLPAGNILFVDADAPGLNTGLNWAQAYTELQDALTVAAIYPGIVTEVRVAEGTYKPDLSVGITPGDRTATFQLISGLTIKGGYAGHCEPKPNDRDIDKYETILSGDLNGDDIEIVYPENLFYEPTRTDNSYHVLTGSETDATALLDGFTVVAGNANGYRGRDYDSGGGMYNFYGSPTVMNCIFKCNSANDDGGGMYNRTRMAYDSIPILNNCTFEGNSARVGGGACNEYSSPILRHCTFRDNWARDLGGGVSGMNSHATLIDCSFYRNHADGYGGGGISGVARAITNCIFIENSSNWTGGGMYSSDSPTITNCIFIGNSAGQSGGGMQVRDGNPMLINCTLSGNSAGKEGGGIFSKYSDPELTNCILWGNWPQQIGEEGYPVSVIYCDIQGGWPGEANMDVNPLFRDPDGADDILGTEDDNLRLSIGSPCIDAGDPNYIAGPNETDLDGKPRVIAGRIDMGAYEFQSYLILYVDADATGANDGSSWTDAFNFLQDALAIAYYGDEIRVAQGIYKPDQGAGITPGDRDATFQLINGVNLKGGYAGFGEKVPNARDIQLYETILSGDLNGDDDPDFANNGENSYHVVTGSGTYQTAILDGFTITGGNANGSWLLYQDDGGGLINYASSPTIGNCTFTGNCAGGGGGIYNESSSPTLFNCTIRYNVARGSGSGMCNRDNSNPTVTNCTFSFNVGLSYHDSLGVGMYNYKSNPILSNCAFIGNFGSFGAGMCNYYSDPKLTSCTFIGNKVHAGGGGMANLESSPILVNCTFTKNWSDWYGVGGMENCCSSNPILTNCILWSDMPGEISDSAVVTYSNVQGGWPGTGNIDAEPSFVSPGYWDTNDTPDKPWDDFWIDGDYHLLPDSPCIDAGDPNYIQEPNDTDLDGKPRVLDGDNDGVPVVDMGAYEKRFAISAEARILPQTINLASKGNWITCYIWLPDEYDATDIEPNSVFLEDDVQPEQFSVDEQQQLATARFSRKDVQPILGVGDINLKITGRLTDGTNFDAIDTIKVIDNAVKN